LVYSIIFDCLCLTLVVLPFPFRKYKDGLFRIILSPDGNKVLKQSDPPIPLVGDNTLSVTQAPDGSLIDTRYLANSIFIHKPIQVPTKNLTVYGVFPRRGSVAGGYNLYIHGINFEKGTPSVTVGGKSCPVQSNISRRIVCVIKGGTGNVDVVVKIGKESSTFARGFRYITGLPG
jgi:IPT/TIG domain